MTPSDHTPPLRLPALAGWIVLCFSAAALGGFFGPGEWYASLRKPSWNPPGWVFGPVWTVLYTLMGVSAWQVWRRGGWTAPGRPLHRFLAQLALNALWTPLFFGLKQPGLAFVEILALGVVLALTLWGFRRVHAPAAWMLVPYLGWVGFAAVLNGTLWWMNQ